MQFLSFTSKKRKWLIKYGSIEDVLLSGIVNEELLEPFVELNVSDLKLQLQHFRRKRPVKSDSMDSNSVGYTYSHNTLNHRSLIDHVFVHKDVVPLISEYRCY